MITIIRRPGTNMDKVRETLQLFEGTHNFMSFALKKSSRIARTNVDEETGEKVDLEYTEDFFTRTVDKISLVHVDPPCSPMFQPIFDMFDFWIISSFLIHASYVNLM